MKHLIIIGLTLLVFTSCHNYKKDADRLKMQRDSIRDEAAFRDSLMVDALNDFNEIQATLDSIKVIEKVVSAKAARGNEMNKKQKQQILDDIVLLNQLIETNKDKTSALQKKLNNANYKAGKLNSTIAQLEKMVKSLENQLAEKDVEILALKETITDLHGDISTLNEKIAEIESENVEKTNTIEEQTLELNKAYYAYGSIAELKENQVVERTGGLIGIGKTKTIKEDFNRDYFTEIDIREFDFIPLMVKKAEVVSVHSAGSFHISGEKTADTLFIDNKTEFWKASKFLVIVTK
ncbi:hypothetical protein OU798_02405 [Prolixibacteraceae bacterium Z1-6]|uniref:Chromosome partition protein Smc n=1 Tax=Draconibacterium aestuarii TaxID=2998507 RepID=A0A9X3J398_9BACT|nr:hypothetical protein [Prolixibacteraceae bacterium Z1-6]